MKKLFSLFVVVIVLLMISGVFAASVNISGDIEKFVKEIARKKGKVVGPDASVKKVDFNNLPPQINLQNVDDTNLGLYEVDLGDGESIFVLTLSEDTFEQKRPDFKRAYLNFGFKGNMDSSGFLETATGVEGSVTKGYVMVRDGSITGLSTNLEVIKLGEDQVEIIIYKNGIPFGFSNSLNSFVLGVQNDYDIQSEGTIKFKSGDIISVYIKAEEGVVWRDVTTLLEIATN